MSRIETNRAPVEVWLRQAGPLAVGCTVVFEDRSTEAAEVTSLSMRGAQREVTARLQKLGYRPARRWGDEAAGETSRTFTREAKEMRDRSTREAILDAVNEYERLQAQYLSEPSVYVEWADGELIAATIRPLPVALTDAWKRVADGIHGEIVRRGIVPTSTELSHFANRHGSPPVLTLTAIGNIPEGWTSLERYEPITQGMVLGRSTVQGIPPVFYFGLGVVFNDFGSWVAPGTIARSAVRQLSDAKK